MSKDIWVYIEQNQGSVAPVSLELLNEAVRLKGRMKAPGKVIALIIGDELGQLTETCFRHGAEQVYTAADPRLSLYHPEYYAEIIVRMIRSHDPHIFLFGATCTGSQLAPMTAARVNTGVAAHSTELKLDEDDSLIAVVPAFGGRVLGDILIPGRRPQMASIKPGILEKAAVISRGDDLQNKGEGKAISLDFLDRISARLQPLRLCREEVRGMPLEEADLVLCGGFGVGDSENWTLLQALADKMGGALGCTRP
ncbi:MAG: electron transfer flavoprotein subunit alpha/FixB family protein, partial [Bacillota bacterium]|nr:electron transfer flavoprotein subunit alpha/FixB family protein [Bacillota bacterium]